MPLNIHPRLQTLKCTKLCTNASISHPFEGYLRQLEISTYFLLIAYKCTRFVNLGVCTSERILGGIQFTSNLHPIYPFHVNAKFINFKANLEVLIHPTYLYPCKPDDENWIPFSRIRNYSQCFEFISCHYLIAIIIVD